MNKKIIVCLIICVVLIFLLCACQEQNASQTQSESTATEELQTESRAYSFLRTFSCLFLLLFGGIELVNPRKIWDMTKGRNKKPGSKEPTPAELNGERVSGLLLILLGVCLYFGMIQ